MLKLLIFSLLICMESYAFTLNNNVGAAFKTMPISIYFNSSSCTNVSLSDQDFLSLIQDAVDTFWNQATTSRIKLVAKEAITLSTSFKTGLLCSSNSPCVPNSALAHTRGIVISCNQNSANFSSSTAVLGVTLPHSISGNAIVGSTFLINDMAGNEFEKMSYGEKRSVVAHELGHAIGLGHSPDQSALMHYRHNETRYMLGHDDIDGVTYLYPSTLKEVAGCGSISTPSMPLYNILLSLFLGFLLSTLLTKITFMRD